MRLGGLSQSDVKLKLVLRTSAEGVAIEERNFIAVHEAGHAVVARVLGHSVMRASLADGVRTRYQRGDYHARLGEAAIALAGPLAEQHYRLTTRAEREALWRERWHSDLDNARRHIQACGVDGQWLARQVRGLVHQYWRAIERVAAALQQRGTLTNAEIDRLMRR